MVRLVPEVGFLALSGLHSALLLGSHALWAVGLVLWQQYLFLWAVGLVLWQPYPFLWAGSLFPSVEVLCLWARALSHVAEEVLAYGVIEPEEVTLASTGGDRL